MKPIAFCSVAFGDKRYLEQQDRLIESINEFHPEAVAFHWTNELPTGSKPFLESLYGFKPHAVLQAINEGYERIIWLDPACILIDRLDYLFDLCPKHGVVAVKDDNKLPASDTALAHFKYRREDIADFHLVGGSVYAFDMKYSGPVLKAWHHAEILNIFGSQHEEAMGKLQGHRSDETCMALSLYRHSFQPVTTEEARYNYLGGAIQKFHFK